MGGALYGLVSFRVAGSSFSDHDYNYDNTNTNVSSHLCSRYFAAQTLPLGKK